MTALSETSVVGEADANQVVRSQWLGEIEFGPSSELLFPVGLPGFEGERGMLPVEIPAQKPLVYLQSLTNPEVCFVSLPVFIVDSGFHLHLSDDERSILQLNGDGDPTIGVDVLCLALLMPSLGTVRVNLNAPVGSPHNGFRAGNLVHFAKTFLCKF